MRPPAFHPHSARSAVRTRKWNRHWPLQFRPDATASSARYPHARRRRRMLAAAVSASASRSSDAERSYAGGRVKAADVGEAEAERMRRHLASAVEQARESLAALRPGVGSNSTRQHIWPRAHWAGQSRVHSRSLALKHRYRTPFGPADCCTQASAHGATCAAVIVDPLTDEQARRPAGRWALAAIQPLPSDRAHSSAPPPLSLLRVAFVPLRQLKPRQWQRSTSGCFSEVRPSVRSLSVPVRSMHAPPECS
jgi:hypothetical protein